jgi:hypothetical protein
MSLYGALQKANYLSEFASPQPNRQGTYDSVATVRAAALANLGITSTPANLNLLSGVTAGTVTASKAVVVDANKDIGNFRFVKYDLTTGITAFSGGGQGSAVALTQPYNNITTVAANGDSVKLPASVAGMTVVVANNGANIAQVFGAGTDTIDGIATATGQPLPAKGVGVYVCMVAGNWLSNQQISLPGSKFVTAANTSGFTATGAQVGGAEEVILNLSGALGAGANIQMPTVAALFAAIPNAQINQAYYLRILNLSSGAFAWTVTTNTGWTLTGTMTIAQNFYREFQVSFTSAAAAVLQSLGTAAQSAL